MQIKVTKTKEVSMKKLIKQTKKEIEYALKLKLYSEAELLARTLYTLKSIKAGK